MNQETITIREAKAEDFEALYPILQEVISAGETYGYARDMNREEIEHIWMHAPRQTFVAEADGEILGTYYIKTNQYGQGSHVCNCGYMVSSAARGRGVATQMCLHSQEIATALGYRAMQFNFVASSNKAAVALWQKMGFETAGRLPGAFNHPTLGYIDALVMYKWFR